MKNTAPLYIRYLMFYVLYINLSMVVIARIFISIVDKSRLLPYIPVTWFRSGLGGMYYDDLIGFGDDVQSAGIFGLIVNIACVMACLYVFCRLALATCGSGVAPDRAFAWSAVLFTVIFGLDLAGGIVDSKSSLIMTPNHSAARNILFFEVLFVGFQFSIAELISLPIRIFRLGLRS